MTNLPKDVKIIINDYLDIFNTKLPDLMESFYLIGSVALNDYHKGKSDIDFISIIKKEINASELEKVKEIHKKIEFKYTKSKLEGSYVTPKQVRVLDKNEASVVYFDGKNIRYGGKSGNTGIVAWFILKNYGITVTGKPPEHYVPHIDVDDLVSYVKLNANTYWTNWTEKASKRFSVDSTLALFEQKVEWGVLGISRLYYTMYEGDIVSKCEAGKYVLNRVPPDFEKILNEALRIRKGESKSYYSSPFKRRKDTLSFMKYMIGLID
ncbi:MAG: aminoglycoside adenylyltransferase domain-containing protein [Methanobacterium sp.]